MMKFSKSEFYYQLFQTSNIISAGILWIICSIPIITFGASTSAYYRILFDIRKTKRTTAKMFFKYFAESFKNGTLLCLAQIVTSLPIIFFTYLVFFLPKDGQINIIECLPVVFLVLIWLAVFCFAYAYTAYFSLDVTGTIKNCFIMAFGFPKYTIPIVIITILFAAVSIIFARVLVGILPAWILIALPLVPWCKSYFLKKVFLNFDDSETNEEIQDKQ